MKTNNGTIIQKFFGADALALKCVKQLVSDATVVRIATAYFEPTGYYLLQQVLRNKEVRLLLGRNEDSEEKIENIVEQFIEDLARADIEDKTAFIQQLRETLQEKKFVINLGKSGTPAYTTLQPRYLFQHAKLYIADSDSVLVTSANLTYHGLVQSREAGLVSDDPDDVLYFVTKFDEYFEQAHPIAEELLQRLEEWLALYPPFYVYIRSLLLLYDLPEEDVAGKLPPLTSYQKPIVSRLVRTIDEHNGAMLIASTGLGKTVMAAHIAAYLRMNGKVTVALVLCPAGLKNMWHRILRAAHISSEEFSYYILSVDDIKKSMDVAHLLSELAHVDEQTLIILDESHHMRNIGSQTNIRLSHIRIHEAVNQKKAKILLMTATPYSTGLDDINAQLMLLPPRNDISLYPQTGMQTCWEVHSAQELSELPPVVVLTSPTVVKYYSHIDENGNRYVLFLNNEKRYFPQKLHFQNIEYSNQCDDILKELLQSNLLYRKKNEDEILLFTNDEGIRDPLWEAQVVHQGCSSIKQMDELLNKLSYEGGFERIRFQNQQELTEFCLEKRKLLKSVMGMSDEKIQKLSHIVEQLKDEKIVIFCHYRETARYVKESLQQCFPQISIDTTVDVDASRVEAIVQRFAPQANKIEYMNDEEYNAKNEIQILVATGAMSEGFNFQDARILINFDMPWTVLTLAQRMGRILRPWPQPRNVYIYNFIPSTMEDDIIYHASRWKGRLLTRNEEIRSFAEIPVLVEKGSEFEMIHLARSIALFGDHDLDLDEVLEFIETADGLHTSGFIDDIAKVDDALKRQLLSLPMGVRSVKSSRLKLEMVLYILFKCKNRFYPVLFDAQSKIMYDSDRMDDIMQIIRSAPEEDISAPLPDDIDVWIMRAKHEWVIAHQFNTEEVMIDCAMVIIS
ncbi:MAG: helicase-related protein [Spirochaetota bacterium]